MVEEVIKTNLMGYGIKMKTKIQILTLLIFSIFLINSVSAIVTSGIWEDNSTSIEIEYGESVNFDFYFFTFLILG